ncbi:MAG: FAD-dependent oxidoreductase [Candidatus Omnitrophota bacterium]|jgi:UDP-galactopyranose mutase
MVKKRIIILGAGVAGLSAAWHLQKNNIDCHVYEKEDEVGGLCRSQKIENFTFDYCGHVLHFRHAYVFDLIKKMLGGNLAAHRKSAWVHSFGVDTRYPFQANLFGLPHSVVEECLLGFIEAQKSDGKGIGQKQDFSSWIHATFGNGIARHFMIPYNTKFWTIAPEKMTCEWFDGFIPVPTLREVVEGTIEESKRQFGYNARFWYPKQGGISQVPQAFAKGLANICTGIRVTGINLEKKEITLSSGHSQAFDCLISTLPLPEVAKLLHWMPPAARRSFAKLRWNSIYNLNLGFDGAEGSRRHWIYYPKPDVCFFRAGFPHNFSSDLVPAHKSSLYIEVAYSQKKDIDKRSIIARIKKDLKKVGLFSAENHVRVSRGNDIQYGYPLYDRNYNLARSVIVRYLLGKNMFLCGRYGSWRYMSMEDAILDGKNTAESFLL